MLEAGQVIGGYRVDGVRTSAPELGTFDATQVALDRPVDLHVIDVSDATSDFTDEVLALSASLATIDHPNLQGVLETGMDGARLFRVAGAASGRSLRQAVAAGLDAAGALDAAGQVAAGLDALHAQGIVHGGVCPDAVRLLDDGSIRLLSPPLPVPGSALTTADAAAPEAIAPEVLKGAPATAAADRYALAATIQHALTGQPIFSSPEAALTAARSGQSPQAANAITGDVPEAASRALQVGLASDPQRRPDSAKSLVDDIVAGFSLGAATSPESLHPGSSPDTAEPAAGARRPLVLGTAALAAVAAVIIGVAMAGGGDDGPDIPPMADGAVLLGSPLLGADSDVQTLDCNGEEPSEDSRSCTIMQTALPGAVFTATEDGAIRGWTLRGAEGTFRLQVQRPRDGGFFQVFTSQVEEVTDRGIHRFDANTGIVAGDVISVNVMAGGLGYLPTDGATIDRWLPPREGGPPSAADLPAGSGMDFEALVRVEYLPGESVIAPETISGSAAADLPAGEVLEELPVAISAGYEPLLAVVRLEDGSVAMDLFDGDLRVSRMFAPAEVDPAGTLARLDAFAYGDDVRGGIGFEWQNPERPRPFEYYIEIRERELAFIN